METEIIARELNLNERNMLNLNRRNNKELSLRSIIEGLLYIVGEEGISIEQLCLVLEEKEEIIQKELNNLSIEFQNNNALELVYYGGKYKIVTSEAIMPYAQKLLHNYKPQSLSQAAMETLAIIAYKQPITRIEIEELRGVSSDIMLRKLCARNLIKEAGRSDAPGRPILYEVTSEFMDCFKLVSLEELPDLPELNEEISLFD